jgi:putative lipoic acid-binding regulatory protein
MGLHCLEYTETPTACLAASCESRTGKSKCTLRDLLLPTDHSGLLAFVVHRRVKDSKQFNGQLPNSFSLKIFGTQNWEEIQYDVSNLKKRETKHSCLPNVSWREPSDSFPSGSGLFQSLSIHVRPLHTQVTDLWRVEVCAAADQPLAPSKCVNCSNCHETQAASFVFRHGG